MILHDIAGYVQILMIPCDMHSRCFDRLIAIELQTTKSKSKGSRKKATKDVTTRDLTGKSELVYYVSDIA